MFACPGLALFQTNLEATHVPRRTSGEMFYKSDMSRMKVCGIAFPYHRQLYSNIPLSPWFIYHGLDSTMWVSAFDIFVPSLLSVICF